MVARQKNGRSRDGETDLVPDPTVIACDPGGITGWSVMSVHPEALCDPDVLILDNIKHWAHGEIVCNGPGGKYSPEMESAGSAEFLETVDAWPGALVVIEDYVVRTPRMDKETVTPIRLIGALDFGLWLRRRTSAKQMPSEKAVASDERMRQWGLYERAGGMGHARDADRHAIVMLRKLKARRQLRPQYFSHIYAKGGDLHK